MVLLDLSAAFDTIDHSILKRRLQMSFGIRGSALTWFESYLTNRQQTVVTGQYRSSPVTLRYGVPQGSVLGHVLFSLYAQPLTDIFDTHGFSFHIYADDSQLYGSTEVNDVSVVTQSLNECVIL
ncbi:reverse transcriptase-like protein [Elysia marginata]|uniref:Reverse transcriptase-like protein n=1 Tax=Elysia marginata TaxID=1093978 RepID=A0AAV4GTD5_9GAST|nr:reverse transcriptase-like protein [Elysia marginata]